MCSPSPLTEQVVGTQGYTEKNDMNIAYATLVTTPLGEVWLCATEQGLCALAFGGGSARLTHHLMRHGIAEPQPGHLLILEEAARQVVAYLERRTRAFDLPLDLRGTPFQQEVWAALRRIPYGQTRTYGEIALELERPRAAQAVGQAVGANPVALVVPCHRVVGSEGELRGYAYGLERKAELLRLEQAGTQLPIPAT
jgi:O-6-methylguanine DNA methyltransferase